MEDCHSGLAFIMVAVQVNLFTSMWKTNNDDDTTYDNYAVSIIHEAKNIFLSKKYMYCISSQ